MFKYSNSILVLCLMLSVTLVRSISFGSGCDDQIIYVSKDSLKKIDVGEDLGSLSVREIADLMRDYDKKYDGSFRFAEAQLPEKGDFIVRTQWSTYENLDTDCGWEIHKYTVKMKQLVIQMTDNQVVYYPSVYNLFGEHIAKGPYLEITERK